jgi:hypothetical protein
MHTVTRTTILLVLLAFVAGAAPARAEIVHCTPITALPAVITVQGVYCFTGDLATAMASRNAIDIQTNNVVLDLNGFKLGDLAAGPGTGAIGIYAVDRQNVTIKNGTIGGFLWGILLNSTSVSQGHIVADIRADRNTFVGIEVHGDGIIIRNNQVVATGGTTIVPARANTFGIIVEGNGLRVLNNDVIKVEVVKQGTGKALGIGLLGVTDGSGLAVHNRITEADIGIEYAGFITGKYRDNLTFGVTTPYIGGTDAGNNN